MITGMIFDMNIPSLFLYSVIVTQSLNFDISSDEECSKNQLYPGFVEEFRDLNDELPERMLVTKRESGQELIRMFSKTEQVNNRVCEYREHLINLHEKKRSLTHKSIKYALKKDRACNEIEEREYFDLNFYSSNQHLVYRVLELISEIETSWHSEGMRNISVGVFDKVLSRELKIFLKALKINKKSNVLFVSHEIDDANVLIIGISSGVDAWSMSLKLEGNKVEFISISRLIVDPVYSGDQETNCVFTIIDK